MKDDAGSPGLLYDWLSHRFSFTEYPSLSGTAPRQMLLTLAEIAEMISQTNADGSSPEDAKAKLPLLSLCLYGDKKTPFRMVGGKRTGGSLRHDGNITAITGVAGDYDLGQISFEVAEERLTKIGILGILYASPRHTPENPRWRFLAFFSRPITGHENGDTYDRLLAKHTMYMGWLNGVFGPEGAFDAACWNASQSFFFGSGNRNPHHRVAIIDGMPMDLMPELDIKAVGKPGAGPKGRKPRLVAADGQTIAGEDDLAARVDTSELVHLIKTGQSIHNPIMQLLGKWKNLGMIPAWDRVNEIMDSCPDDVKATDRWKERRETIPAMVEHCFGKDAMRKFERKQTRDERHANAEAARARAKEAIDPELPVIDVIGGLRHIAVDMAMKAMKQAGVRIYQRDKHLMRVAAIRSKASDGAEVMVPGMIEVSSAILGRAMGRTAMWRRTLKSGDIARIDPPKEVVEQVGDMVGAWPFDPLLGVVGTATLRPDCSILSKPGYDPATGLYLYAPPPMPEIPEHPTRDDAYRALMFLNELLIDFPFVDDVSRSVAMSMQMTPVLRGALAQAVPMHVVTAPTPGTGKSYVVDLSSAIAVGERQAVINVSNKPEETEKRLVAAALAGQATIALDNCNGLLEGDFLAQVTERPRLILRPLGGSGQVTISNTFTVFANGNNITITMDLVRRTIRCTLDAKVEDPGNRVFAGDPVKRVLANRGAYVAAILTIVRAFHLAGEPYEGLRLHSYERWAVLIAGSLVWLGWPNPISSTNDLRAEDPERQRMASVFEAFPTYMTDYYTQELVNATNETDVSFSTAWRDAATQIGRDRFGKIAVKPLGDWLRYHKDRPVDGRKIVNVSDDKTRPRWRVVKI